MHCDILFKISEGIHDWLDMKFVSRKSRVMMLYL